MAVIPCEPDRFVTHDPDSVDGSYSCNPCPAVGEYFIGGKTHGFLQLASDGLTLSDVSREWLR